MLDDEELTGRQPFQIAQRGLALVPQSRRIFSSLTVEENLTLAARGTHAGDAWTPEQVYELFPQLKGARATRAASCPAASCRCWRSAGPC